MEERGLTKKNGKQPLMVRTQCRVKHVARTVWRTSGGRNWSRRLGPNATRLVNIQGRSLTAKMGTGTADGASPRFRRMRSFRTYGSVRGAVSNGRPLYVEKTKKSDIKGFISSTAIPMSLPRGLRPHARTVTFLTEAGRSRKSPRHRMRFGRRRRDATIPRGTLP